MLNEQQWHAAVAILPFLADPAAEVTRAFVAEANVLCFPATATVFEEGDRCNVFAILLCGRVRVFKIGESGREITLYRFARGESCILTASCILSDYQFPAIAVVEEEVQAFVLAQSVLYAWVDSYPAWRSYIFQLLSQRFASVLAVIDDVAFRRMDARIAAFLLHQLSADRATSALTLTHQQIAAELGSSREVVSRLLADFAAGGLVQMTRGQITVLDRAGLAQRAALEG